LIKSSLLCGTFLVSASFAGSLSFIAFDYHRPDREDLLFLSNFHYVVTGGFLKKEEVEFLKRRGVKLLYYEWLPAEYVCSEKTDDGWKRKILKNINRWVIDDSPTDPDPMGRRYGCRDYFFSFTDDFVRERVRRILHNLKEHGYDGVFFDWAAGSKIFEQKEYSFLQEKLKKKFPGIDYDKQVEKFLRVLKKKGVIIALNRGFRSKGAVFDRWADIDVAESVFTTDSGTTACGTRFIKPETAVSAAESFVKKAKNVNPSINFVFLNYALPYCTFRKGKDAQTVDKQAILYALSLSLLVDSFSFTAGKDVGLSFVKSGYYFLNPGKPLGKCRLVRADKGRAWVREFSNGFVVVGEPGTSVAVDARGHKRAYDVLEGKEITAEGGRFIVHLKSLPYPGGRFRPVGKVILFGKDEK